MDEQLRRTVRERADHRCEYCCLPQDAEPFFVYHVEHIVARQHGGSDDNGEAGIRTLGTLLRYNALAKRRFRPLSHLTKICGAKAISRKRGASNETFGSDPPRRNHNRKSSSSLTPLTSLTFFGKSPAGSLGRWRCKQRPSNAGGKGWSLRLL